MLVGERTSAARRYCGRLLELMDLPKLAEMTGTTLQRR
jgi:hypothetical protein